MDVDITQASSDRLIPLASVLGRSFVVEPMLSWSLGDHGDLAQRFTRAFEYFLEDLIPLGMVWEAGNAAAVWVPPDGAAARQEAQTRGGRLDGLTLMEGAATQCSGSGWSRRSRTSRSGTWTR